VLSETDERDDRHDYDEQWQQEQDCAASFLEARVWRQNMALSP